MSQLETPEVRPKDVQVDPSEPTPAAGDLATDPSAPAEPRRSALAHTLFLMGKRRQFLVHRRSQLRASLMATLVVLALLALLNISLHSARERSAATLIQDAPELTNLIEAQNRFEMILVLLASVVFLGGVFFVTLLETHKTAGAAYNVVRHLYTVRDGQFSTRLRLRQDDNLQEIEPAFNDMCRSLQELSFQDAEALERFAVFAEQLASQADGQQLATELRCFANAKRHLAG